MGSYAHRRGGQHSPFPARQVTEGPSQTLDETSLMLIECLPGKIDQQVAPDQVGIPERCSYR